MTVHPSHAVAMLGFGGRSYYFCSEDCSDKFKVLIVVLEQTLPQATPTMGGSCHC